MALIQLDNVSFSYPESKVRALDSVSLTINSGEYIALVGRNGSGKSTLVRLFNGLRKASSGVVSVLGLNASISANHQTIRSAVTLVFQSPQDQIISSIVEKDIAFGPENLGLPKKEIEERVESAIHAVALETLRKRPTRFLSGGQLQKVALAGALAMRPRCIIFDEATSMLDPVARQNLLQHMELMHKSGTTIIHVTHDMDEAAKADRIILMDKGRICFDGSPKEFFGYVFPSYPRPRTALMRDGGSLYLIQVPLLNPSKENLTVSEKYGLGLPLSLQLMRILGLPPEPGISIEDLARKISKRLSADPENLFSHFSKENSIQLPAQINNLAINEKNNEHDSAILMEDVAYRYLLHSPFRQEALKNVTLNVKRGARVALVGAAGSGKSTSLQLMNAILLPSEGKVVVKGIDTRTDAAIKSLRTSVPLAIQRPETALFEVYAGDDVAFGPRNMGLRGTELVSRVRTWMDAAGLPYLEFRDRPVRSLSGGEKRRLALAGVFALESDIILLDEPSAALDPESRSQIFKIIDKASEKKSTVVYATHSPEEAAQADFVAVFKDGQLKAYGTQEEIFSLNYSESWGIRRPLLFELQDSMIRTGIQNQIAARIVHVLEVALSNRIKKLNSDHHLQNEAEETILNEIAVSALSDANADLPSSENERKQNDARY